MPLPSCWTSPLPLPRLTYPRSGSGRRARPQATRKFHAVSLFLAVSSMIFPLNCLTFQGPLGKAGPQLASSTDWSLPKALPSGQRCIFLIFSPLSCRTYRAEFPLSAGAQGCWRYWLEWIVVTFFFFLMNSLHNRKASDFTSYFHAPWVLVATALRGHVAVIVLRACSPPFPKLQSSFEPHSAKWTTASGNIRNDTVTVDFRNKWHQSIIVF